jgi:peptidoglycan hydrolase CwlO-like protein
MVNQNQVTIEQIESMHSADTGNIVKILGRKDDLISNLLRENIALRKDIESIKQEVEKLKSKIETAKQGK